MEKKRVVIIGAGFGGLTAAKLLGNVKNLDVIIIDKTNHHLFQPLLYQVATAALSPGDIASPIRTILRKFKNIIVVMGEVVSIDRIKKRVILEDRKLTYDYLIVAPGSRHSYFGNETWERNAPGLKTLDDALQIRENILIALEEAELIRDQSEKNKYMTFVVIGGGPTGVEMAGAIAEIAKKTVMKDFKSISPADTKIFLIEAQDRILNIFDESLSLRAKSDLEKLGVEVLLNSSVTSVTSEGVQVGNQFIPSKNIIWAAGNTASPLLKSLNTEIDRAGRVIVKDDLSVNDSPEVFVIGDAAALKLNEEKLVPGVCPAAIQEGEYVAKIIKKNIPIEKRKPFKYKDKGTLATIGKSLAVGRIFGLNVKGFIAWFLWSFVHIFYLIEFRNRFRVMAEWIWYYFTNRNGVRLITGRTKK